MTKNKNLISKIEVLNELQSIALVLWCMDRAFLIFKVVKLKKNYQSERLVFFIEQAAVLWNWPSNYDIAPLRSFCEDFNIEAIKIESVNYFQQNNFFFEYKYISNNHIFNAILNSIGILYNALRIRSCFRKDIIMASVEIYYDIFYQPTFTSLTVDRKITPDFYKQVSDVLEDSHPLKTALKLLESHVMLVSGIERIDFSDPSLRGF